MRDNNLFLIPRRIFAGIDALARHRAISILFVFFLSFAGSWLWSLSSGIPVPYTQDEFSYLLAADTFAHGRVTNPTHPMGEHFETFQVLQRPTYMSKYPPAQGFCLAVGKVLFGHAIYGVWLSSAGMCAAICWMLYAWFPSRWALIGGLIAVLQFGIFTYWSQSYWGGAVAALGGALVLGALPRIFKGQRIQDAVWLGLGCAVLANSRPLEGFLLALPVGCLVLPWKIKRKEILPAFFAKKVLVPLVIILSMTAAGIGAYNKQITGRATAFPHVFWDRTYTTPPFFIFQSLRPSTSVMPVIADIREHTWVGKKEYLYKRTVHGYVRRLFLDSLRLSEFFLGFPLALPLLIIVLLFSWSKQKAWKFIFACLLLLAPNALTVYSVCPHYFSPLTCSAVFLITLGLRVLACLKSRNKRVGAGLVVLLMVLQLFLNLTITPRLWPVRSLAAVIQGPPMGLPSSFTREELKDTLLKKEGRYLVIVKYPLNHNYNFEWVYNEADINRSPIVWARSLGEAADKELLDYFKDRQTLWINVVWDMRGFPRYDARQ